MTERLQRYGVHGIDQKIVTIRGQKVILDADLAAVYGVATKRLNEQVRRNADRFPEDFVFRLTPEEFAGLKSLPARSGSEQNWSQNATSSRKHRGLRYCPYAFTEHGAIMAANVLNSPQSIMMSVFVVRVFVRMRQELFSRSEMEKRLLQVEKILLGHDDRIRDIYEKIRPLLLPPAGLTPKKIGFHVREKVPSYRTSRKKGASRLSKGKK